MNKKLTILTGVALIAALLFTGVQTVYAHEAHIHVDIDIKPGSYPNAINIKNNGVVPIALLGSAAFDVHGVNVSTVEFGPMHHDMHDGGASPLRYAYEDANGDGYVDVLFYFETRAIGLQPGDTEACLHGELIAGGHFCGHDTVKVIG